MLMSSKICIKCVGRLNQLFDFNLIKTNIDIHLGAERNQSEDCRFCNGTADMRGSFIDSVKKAVAATKWFEVRSAHECFFIISFEPLIVFRRIRQSMKFSAAFPATTSCFSMQR